MRGLALSLVLLAAGCSGHSSVQSVSSGAPATGVSTGGSVSINVQPNSAVSTAIAIGLIAGAVYGSERDSGVYGIRTRANPFMAIQPTMSAPRLDESRRVLEQDCTKPIEDWSANLKCR